MFDIKILGNEIYLYYDNRQYLLHTSNTPLTSDDIRWAEGLVVFIEKVTKERINHELSEIQRVLTHEITSMIE